MRRIRVIPTLLIMDGQLVKSLNFKKYKYVGDPINALRIYNEKEVDEIIILDINASSNGFGPNFDLISSLAEEAFMPFSYGGGIKSMNQVESIFNLGCEKIILNTQAIHNTELVHEVSKRFGSQSVVISIDYKKNILGKNKVFINNGKRNTGLDPIIFSKKMQDLGAGEIMLNCITRDGTYKGYDIEYLKKFCSNLEIPVICCGGASNYNDFYEAVNYSNVSAVAAGSMFVFKRPNNAVLINYPKQEDLKNEFFNKLIEL